jgi:hypothetical protein
MAENDIIDSVRRGFRFLFDDYGYRTIAAKRFENSGNWLVVLQSPACGRLLVLHDRGEIIVALGPLGPNTSATDVPWFDLGVVVEHLSAGKQKVFGSRGDPDEQMAWSADKLRPYMDSVCGLFEEPAFGEARPSMDSIGARRERELRNIADRNN